MSYKIQNRSPDSKRIKIIKRTDGKVLFTGAPVPTFQENTIQAGWCLIANSPVPELTQPSTTFELTASPIGVDGRVSLYRNETLVSSLRYNNLSSNADKVKWFNDFFGAVVLMAVINGVTVFTIREEESVVKLVFEDDDIDYVFGDIKPWANNRPAFFREQYRLAVAVKLTEIDCKGAIDFAGVITLDDEVSGAVNNSTGSVDYSNNEELITAMEGKGFTMVELGDWIPRELEFYPRQSIKFTPIPGKEDFSDEVEPSNLTVELTDQFGNKTTHSGKVTKVIDSCRLKGILIRFAWDNFQIGCEPGTPYTKVKATFADRTFDPTPDNNWQFSKWQNPTMVLSNNNRTISGDFGWTALSQFWCFSEFGIVGATGNAGDTLYFPNIDFTAAGTLNDNLRAVTVNTDFTETCSWNTQHPEECRRLHQIDEATGAINVKVASLGGKIFDFNQNPVWGPVGTVGRMCSEEDYRPTAIRWTSGTENYGYSIPEPELPM